MTDSKKTAGSNYSKETLDRHKRLAGGLGAETQDIYTSLIEEKGVKVHSRKEQERQDDLRLFTQLLKPEILTIKCAGRCHKAFPNIVSDQYCKNLETLREKIKKTPDTSGQETKSDIEFNNKRFKRLNDKRIQIHSQDVLFDLVMFIRFISFSVRRDIYEE